MEEWWEDTAEFLPVGICIVLFMAWENSPKLPTGSFPFPPAEIDVCIAWAWLWAGLPTCPMSEDHIYLRSAPHQI